MIKSFNDKITKQIFYNKRVKGVELQLTKKAKRRLDFLDATVDLEDLYFPPSNHFHALQGLSPTRYAISVDRQWRITFEWNEGNAHDVLFEDYH